MSGTGGLTMTAGSQTLSGANTYTGATTINGGTLTVNGSLSDSTAVLVAAGANYVLGASDTIAALTGAGNVNLNGNTLTLGNASGTYSGVMSGTGALVVASGVQTMSGSNTYSGGTTILGGVTLLAGADTVGAVSSGPFGTGLINVNNGATLDIHGYNISNALSLSGVGINNIGALTNSSATPATATGPITLNAAVSIGEFAAKTITLSGGISGTFGLSINSGLGQTGTVIINHVTNATTTTTINAGVLQIGDGVNAGSFGSGNITNNGLINFNVPVALNVPNLLSGTGSVTLTSGLLSLNSANTYSGSTNLNGGTLVVASTNTIGSGNINFVGGVLQYATGFNADLSNRFSNTNNQAYAIDTNGQTVIFNTALNSVGGTFNKLGLGTLVFATNNTYTGSTVITAGQLQLGNGGNVGSIGSGALTNLATLVIDRSDSITMANNMSGVGNIVQAGTGTLTLTGTNTYTGTTTINSASTIQIGNGGTTGTLGSGNVIDNGMLSFNRSTDLITANNISGTGNVSQNGSGMLTLSGNNTFTGNTQVNGAYLNLGSNNAFGSTATVISNNGSLGTSFNAVLTSLIVNGDVTLMTNIPSTGTQVYNGAVTLGGGNAIAGIVTPLVISTVNSNITFNSTINGGIGSKVNKRSLSIDAGTGIVTFNGEIGNPVYTADQNIYQLYVKGQKIIIKADITTFETQIYDGAVLVGDNGTNGVVRTLLSEDPSVTFLSTIDDLVANTHTLNVYAVAYTMTSSRPLVTFDGAIGGLQPLYSIVAVTGLQNPTDRFSSIITDPASYVGTVSINANVTTQSNQIFTAQNISLGNTGGLLATNSVAFTTNGGNVTFNVGLLPPAFVASTPGVTASFTLNGGAVNASGLSSLVSSGIGYQVNIPASATGAAGQLVSGLMAQGKATTSDANDLVADVKVGDFEAVQCQDSNDSACLRSN